MNENLPQTKWIYRVGLEYFALHRVIDDHS